MSWSKKTEKNYFEFYAGSHEHTLLSIQASPLYKKDDHIGFCLGLSVFYFTLFYFEWVRFIKPKHTTVEYD